MGDPSSAGFIRAASDVTEEKGVTVLSKDGKRYRARDAAQQSAAYTSSDSEPVPNMLFVPLKTREPLVPAREFMVFIAMLLTFTIIHGQQHFQQVRTRPSMRHCVTVSPNRKSRLCLCVHGAWRLIVSCSPRVFSAGQDFNINRGMANVCNVHTDLVGFLHISTLGDYAAWWPSFVVALHSWRRPRGEDATAGTVDSTAAVLIGMPLIMQRRQTGAAFAINGTTGMECPWAMRDYGEGRGRSCYGAPMGWSGADPLMGADGTPGQRGEHDVVYLDRIADILNGSVSWDPLDWIDMHTVELVHYVQVWLPGEKRIATVKIAATVDSTGHVHPRDGEGSMPVFRAQEPFMSQTDPLWFHGEMMFYCVMAYYLLVEFTEVWDCICMQEMLLPLEILADSFSLALLEITHYHAKTSEVYDPRDPTTHAAFSFPDTVDLEEHLKHFIKPIQGTMEREVEELNSIRIRIANMKRDVRDDDLPAYKKCHAEMVEMHTELMTTRASLDREVEIAETASMLQLAVMWHNRWSMDVSAHCSFIAEATPPTCSPFHSVRQSVSHCSSSNPNALHHACG